MFTINQYPSEKGVYRIDIPFDPMPLESQFSSYWENTGKPNVMEALNNSPFQLGMFYQPSGFADDGSPLKPTDWETGILVGDDFEQAYNADPSMAVWFQPGNIAITPAQKEPGGPLYVYKAQAYLVVGQDVDFSGVPTTFEPNDFFTQLLRSTEGDLSGLGYCCGGLSGILTGASALTIALVSLFFTALTGFGIWYIFYSGRMSVHVNKAMNYGERLIKKTGGEIKRGIEEVIAAEKKKITVMLNNAKNSIARMFDAAGQKGKDLVERSGVKFQKAIGPLKLALWAIVALGAGYGLVKVVLYFKDKGKRKSNPLIKRTKRKARARIHRV